LKRLGIQQNLSTAFHPQTDGLSKQKNQWVEQYLRLVTSMALEDWMQWLVLATAVHNNRINVTTGLSPNQIILGYDIPINPEFTGSVLNETAEERVRIMNEWQAQAITALNEVARKSGTPLAQYNPGDQVWLEGKNLKLPYQSTKLAPKCYGPFRVIKEISPVAYQLALPPTCFTPRSYHPIAKPPHMGQTSPGHHLT
jgi:hypothetical protein